MLELGLGPVHLCFGPGAGATTLCLSISSTVLECGNRVLWIARDMPDPERTSQILGHLDEEALKRLTVFEIRGGLSTSITATKSLVERLGEQDLLVIDDWCDRYGRAGADDIRAVRELLGRAPICRVVITSAYVSEPVSKGSIRSFVPRGGRSINEVIRLVFLYDDGEKMGYRIIEDDGEYSKVLLTEKGFVPA
ncbi:MAG: hypothetical protein QGH38_03090 [Candidatus Thalassarchaeaceae archaeon]|nr:hypothetical protein [Candidatus Thalassarchaeaceae archaeon]